MGIMLHTQKLNTELRYEFYSDEQNTEEDTVIESEFVAQVRDDLLNSTIKE